MPGALRAALFIAGVVAAVLGVGFFLQAHWATGIWPVPAGPLSNIFVSSILAAIAAPILWIALSGETRAMAGGAVNLAIANGAIAFAAYMFYRGNGAPPLLPFAVFAALVAVLCVGLLLYSRRLAFKDERRTPALVRFSFVGFAIALLLTGGALVLVRPNIFPWPLSPVNSVFYGGIFLGAMCYFLYGAIYPYWGNAKGQLLGFLAYDLVLIVPFAHHFAVVKPQMLLSLTIYTAVVSYSGLLAIFFLFLYPPTRLGTTK
jgi:hypothetical protein